MSLIVVLAAKGQYLQLGTADCQPKNSLVCFERRLKLPDLSLAVPHPFRCMTAVLSDNFTDADHDSGAVVNATEDTAAHCGVDEVAIWARYFNLDAVKKSLELSKRILNDSEIGFGRAALVQESADSDYDGCNGLDGGDTGCRYAERVSHLGVFGDREICCPMLFDTFSPSPRKRQSHGTAPHVAPPAHMITKARQDNVARVGVMYDTNPSS